MNNMDMFENADYYSNQNKDDNDYELYRQKDDKEINLKFEIMRLER